MGTLQSSIFESFYALCYTCSHLLPNIFDFSFEKRDLRFRKEASMEKNRSLILSGSLYRAIFTVSVPLIINNLIQQLYNVADGVWLGQIGTTEFAATAFIFPITFLFTSLGFGLSIAGVSILSRLIGAKKINEAMDYANHLLIVGGLVGSFFAVIGYLITPSLVHLMGGTEDLYRHSITYMRIIFMGYPFVVIYFVFQSMMNAEGSTKSITLVSGISMIVNILVDPFFIFDTVPYLGVRGLGLGVSGAAYATILSQGLMMVGGFFLLRITSGEIFFDFKHFQPKAQRFKKILRVGLPSAVGNSGSALGFLFLNSFIARYGTDTLAAYAMVNRITGLIMMPSMGFGGGLTSIVGQNLGANQKKRAKDAFLRALMLSVALGVIGGIYLYLDRVAILYFFIKKPSGSMVSDAFVYIGYSVVILPLMSAFNTLLGVFNGAGRTDYSMRMTVGRLWVIRLPMIFAFQKLTDLGANGIWIAMLLSNFLTVLYGFVIYKKVDWTVPHHDSKTSSA